MIRNLMIFQAASFLNVIKHNNKIKDDNQKLKKGKKVFWPNQNKKDLLLCRCIYDHFFGLVHTTGLLLVNQQTRRLSSKNVESKKSRDFSKHSRSTDIRQTEH